MSSVYIPQTKEEKYAAIKDMMASNLCARGVFALPTESLAKLSSKILNIDTSSNVRFYQGGTITTQSTSNTTYYPALVTLTPPSVTLAWGGAVGSVATTTNDFRLVSATIRTSWYNTTGYTNYNSVHFIQLESNNGILTDSQWDVNWTYRVVNRPFYSSYPDTSFSNTVQSVSRGAVQFQLHPYSNSGSYAYWHPSYINLYSCNWLVKRPT
jgi:hypothetical protein